MEHLDYIYMYKYIFISIDVVPVQCYRDFEFFVVNGHKVRHIGVISIKSSWCRCNWSKHGIRITTVIVREKSKASSKEESRFLQFKILYPSANPGYLYTKYKITSSSPDVNIQATTKSINSFNGSWIDFTHLKLQNVAFIDISSDQTCHWSARHTTVTHWFGSPFYADLLRELSLSLSFVLLHNTWSQ